MDPNGNRKVRTAPHVLANYATFYFRINECFATGKLTDVSIRCQNRLFKCHRLVLVAASEYFDAMFNGHFAESHNAEIVLHDIDSLIFEELLRFMYRGDIRPDFINDENVYSLLRASDLFGLDQIESRCIRYITERSVPIKHALDIFSLACVTRKLSLIPTVSHFILEHLSQMSRDVAFLNLSVPELSTLLAYFRPSSLEKELTLLDAVFRWSYPRSTYAAFKDGGRELRSLHAKLTQNLQFDHLSPDSIAKYFDLIASEVVFDPSDWDTYDDREDDDVGQVDILSLHVYVNTRVESVKENFSSPLPPPQSPQSNLFSLRECNGNVAWSAPAHSGAGIDNMRTVVVNDRLYSLRSERTWEQFKFSSRPSADFSAGTRPLTAPFDASWLRSNYFNLMCCDTTSTSIYVCSSHRWNDAGSPNLFTYNCELDQWFSIAVTGLNKEFMQTINMTCYDGRVYLIGNGYQVQAYDHRSGKLARLSESGLCHANGDECCSHKEKIYVSSVRDCLRSVNMEFYDPIAGKWGVMETATKTECRENRPFQSHRLLSFDNHLWMLGSHPSSIIVETYDSFLRTWETSDALHNAVQNRMYPLTHVTNDSCLERNLTDVIAFKPL